MLRNPENGSSLPPSGSQRFVTCLGLLSCVLLATSCSSAWWKKGDAGCPNGTRITRHKWTETQIEYWCQTPAGKNHGPSVLLSSTGAKLKQRSFRDGREHGAWRAWYEDGKRAARGEYRHGRRHGRWIGWRRTGKREQLHSYKNGVRHGLWIDYWPSGQIRYERSYSKGKWHGRSRWWAADGTPLWAERHVDGKRVEVVRINSATKPN